jgi:tetratricopeptide (TPR) repeat protein
MSVTRNRLTMLLLPWCRTVFVAIVLLGARYVFAQESLRREVGEPLQKAQAFLQAGQPAAAQAALLPTDALGNKTAREIYWIALLRGHIASKTGDVTRALAAYREALQSGQPSAQEQAALQAQLMPLRLQQIRSLYRAQQFDQVIALMTQPDAPTDEASLSLVAASYVKLDQESGYVRTLERLLGRYPKPAYWVDRLARLQQQAGFAPRLGIELYRLQLTVGAISSGEEFMEMAQLCQRGGFPAEAVHVLDQGLASGKLGADDTAVRALRGKLTAMAQEDAASLSKTASQASGVVALTLNGWALSTMGQHAQGIALLQRALAAPMASAHERIQVQLRLAHAQVLGGQITDARTTFNTITGADGSADLARLWTLHLNKVTP